MQRIHRPLVTVICLFAASVADTARLSDMNWIVGVWQASNGKDQVEIVYLPARNGEILGTFTAIAGTKVVRYELRSIRSERGRIVLQELAYDTGLIPAAPVPTRTVLSTDATHIVFDNSTMVRTGANSMKVTVKLTVPNVHTVEMFYVRSLVFSNVGQVLPSGVREQGRLAAGHQ
jgi:hypothetical protein